MTNWLTTLTDPLNQVVFVLGNDHVTWAEILGFITGAACVWLTVKAHVGNFPVGIANSFFFLILFASARLWADSTLQIIYIVLGFVGWRQWLYGGPRHSRLVVGRSTRTVLAFGVGFIGVSTWGLTLILGAAHDVAPFWDALTTCLSLVAQGLLNWKKVENWCFWIAADLIYIPLYVVKRLDLTAIVYVFFFSMSCMGLSIWRRAIRDQDQAVASGTDSPLGLLVHD